MPILRTKDTQPRYDGGYPTSPAPARVRLSMQNLAGITAGAFDGKEQVQEWPGEWWEMEVTMPPMRRREIAAQWCAWLASTRGPVETFEMGDPSGATPRGAATGFPMVDGAHNAMSKTLNVRGWTQGVTGIMLAFDYLQINDGVRNRLHAVLIDADADDEGKCTLQIFPRLRRALPDGTAIRVANCVGTWRLVQTRRDIDIDKAKVVGIAFSVREAI